MPNTTQHRRAWLYRMLEPSAWPARGLSPINKAVMLLICVAAVIAILESEPTLYIGNESLFLTTEIVLTGIFLVEYIARVWAAGENAAHQGVLGRLRYMLTWTALVDLIALLPIFLVFLGNEAFLLRIFRLIRIIRVARLGRFSSALRAINEAVHVRRFELMMSFAIASMLLLFSSTLLYIVEGGVQPATFGSIPRAMWWSVATLTTVGYGDVFPVTTLGRVFAGLTAITGIGLIAMPTGILASAFSDALQKRDAETGTTAANAPETKRDHGR
ncbi:MAG: ion transporter [Hyphomicrobiaceae bacterium]